ncbi:LacI family DNA-binding transcriptional regulator [Promicromonospora sp. NPDC052451]|uniref:LacI family DNA-binding transcriptional regulator n=1 Tax=Promicromonospora sp. NPDC052451 TaxID=3364407 RepID=UPI0037C5EF63
MAERATSRDVARRAGVAQSTVSYVLAGKGSISAETRKRVLRAVEELNYQPNLVARAMRTRRTGRVAVVMGLPIYNPVRMLAGAGAAAEHAGYTMEVHSVDGHIGLRSQRVLELAGSGEFEGVLSFAPVEPGLETKAPPDVPIVMSANFNDEMHSAGELADATPVRLFIERLASLGHTRFLHVAGPSDFLSARAREHVFTETIEHLGLESLGVVGHGWTGETGVEAVRALPDGTPPVAVIAVNDLVAVGVMRGAAERGWTVPADLSITGWDNYDVGPFLFPSLTTVDTNRAEAGRRAMLRLVAALRKEAPPEHEEPLNQIIWRESIASPDVHAGRQ